MCSEELQNGACVLDSPRHGEFGIIAIDESDAPSKRMPESRGCLNTSTPKGGLWRSRVATMSAGITITKVSVGGGERARRQAAATDLPDCPLGDNEAREPWRVMARKLFGQHADRRFDKQSACEPTSKLGLSRSVSASIVAASQAVVRVHAYSKSGRSRRTLTSSGCPVPAREHQQGNLPLQDPSGGKCTERASSARLYWLPAYSSTFRSHHDKSQFASG
ncbi:hypothetical protein ACVINW_003724 [Bradyrhizobium sp. USDA 4461]